MNHLLNAAMDFLRIKNCTLQAENMPGLFRINGGPELTTNQIISEAQRLGFQPFAPGVPLETKIILALADIDEPAQDVVTALAKRGLRIVEANLEEN